MYHMFLCHLAGNISSNYNKVLLNKGSVRCLCTSTIYGKANNVHAIYNTKLWQQKTDGFGGL